VVQFQTYPSPRAWRRETRREPRHWRRPDRAADAIAAESGYVLVDALVALLIFALALVFSLQAGRQARAAADQASEVRQAHTLLAQLLETGPQQFEDASGAAGAFSWQVETRTTGAERPIEICHRQVAVTNLRTKRAYRAATLETCPLQAPA
jgi:hypothetical protein